MLGLNSVFTKIDVAHYEDIKIKMSWFEQKFFFKDVLNLGVSMAPTSLHSGEPKSP